MRGYTRLVICNTPTGEARKIARHLVENRGGGLCKYFGSSHECLSLERYCPRRDRVPLLTKTADDCLPRLREASDVHPYDVPEIIAFSMDESGLPSVPDMVGRKRRSIGFYFLTRCSPRLSTIITLKPLSRGSQGQAAAPSGDPRFCAFERSWI